MRVRDVMTRGAIGVPATTTLDEAIETMLGARISALLVLDADQVLVGILSEGDLLRRAELGTDRKRPRWVERLLDGGRLADAYSHTHGRRVGEIMTPKVVSVTEDAPLSEAIDLMTQQRVRRLPVLRGDAVVGVISRADVLRALVASLPKAAARHTDAEVRTAIEAELDKLAWAPRTGVRVEVDHGAVTFEGAITDERLRYGLKVVAENIPGVTEVHDRLCWVEPNSGIYMPSEEERKRP